MQNGSLLDDLDGEKDSIGRSLKGETNLEASSEESQEEREARDLQQEEFSEHLNLEGDNMELRGAQRKDQRPVR